MLAWSPTPLRGTRASLLALLVLGVGLGSCRDTPITEPDTPRLRRSDEEVSATNTLTVDYDRGTGTIDLPPFPNGRWVEIVRSGSVTASPEGGSGDSHTAEDPDGLYWSTSLGPTCAMGLSVVYSGAGSIGTCRLAAGASFVDTMWVSGTGSASSTGGIPDAGGYCADNDCYNYSGAHTISVRTLPRPDLVLTADSSTINADNVATFKVSVSNPNVSRKRWVVQQFFYDVDSADITDPAAVSLNNTTTFSSKIRWNGEMAVVALVDNVLDTAWAGIAVRPPPDIFIVPEANGVTWVVGVDSNTSVTYRVKIKRDSAAWWPKLSISTWKSVPIGPGAIWTGSPGKTTHTGPASRSAIVSAHGSIAGRARSAHVTIRVIGKCSVNDSIADTKRVRDSVRAAWARSNASDADKSKRVEIPGYFYQDVNTLEIHAVPVPNLWGLDSVGNPVSQQLTLQRPCNFASSRPTVSASWKLIGDFHSHPFKIGERPFLGCTPGWPPWEPEPEIGGGLSETDWRHLVTDRGAGGYQGPKWTMDADSVYIAEKSGRVRAFKRAAGTTCQAGEIDI